MTYKTNTSYLEKAFFKKALFKKAFMEKGFVAFTSLLIISAIALAISLSVSLLGINEGRSSQDFKRGVETQAISDTCLEEAVYRLKYDAGYLGGSLNVGDGQCSINVSGSGVDRVIDIDAVINSQFDYARKIQVQVKRQGGAIAVTAYVWKNN